MALTSAQKSSLSSALANFASKQSSSYQSAVTSAGGTVKSSGSSSSSGGSSSGGSSSKSTTLSSNFNYQVKSGDTLSGIASQYNVPVSQISGYRSGDPNLIYPGEVLTIRPSGSTTTSKSTTSDLSSLSSLLGSLSPSSQTATYGTEADYPSSFSTDSTRALSTTAGVDSTNLGFTNTSDYESFIESITPDSGAPSSLNRVETYRDLLDEYGVSTLQDQLAQNISAQDELTAQFRAFANKEYEGQSMGMATGRINTQQQFVQQQLDALQRTEKLLTTRLQLKNDTISTIMKLTEADYEDARTAYDNEFNKNLTLVQAFESSKNKEETFYRASYNTLYNNVAASGKSWDELDANVKMAFNTYETALGLPFGLTQSTYTADPKAKIMATGTSDDPNGKEFNWQIVQGEDGVPKVVQTYTGGQKSTSSNSKAKLSRDEEYDIARQIVADNPTAPRAELVAALRENTSLAITDINTVLAEAGIGTNEVSRSDDALKTIADAIVKANSSIWKPKSLEAQNAINTLRANGTSLKSGGKALNLSQRQVEYIISYIQNKYLNK